MNQDGPSLIVNVMFSHMKILLSIVIPCCIYVSSVMMPLVPLDSTYASPGPQKHGKHIITNVHKITSIL